MEVIQAMKKVYPVKLVCRLAGVARSSYYAWSVRSNPLNKDSQLLDIMRRIHRETRRD
ncbi:hypothetical protein PCE31106_04657 [Pandoraea cepalis]|uniref:Transposase n=1 Tax=Pandoraea cepalis TaxID=2508294 RepID=A0A5E4YSN9_9BURK|nr:hypothetical protein PCE31106_04657 [Pandoraea cepalis]